MFCFSSTFSIEARVQRGPLGARVKELRCGSPRRIAAESSTSVGWFTRGTERWKGLPPHLAVGHGFMEEGSLSQKVAASTRAKSHCPSSRRQFAYHYAAQPKLA